MASSLGEKVLSCHPIISTSLYAQNEGCIFGLFKLLLGRGVCEVGRCNKRIWLARNEDGSFQCPRRMGGRCFPGLFKCIPENPKIVVEDADLVGFDWDQSKD